MVRFDFAQHTLQINYYQTTFMKQFHALTNSFSPNLADDFANIWETGHKHQFPRYAFLALCFNLLLAPAVQAATGSELSRTQSYALGILGLGVVALGIYLFIVMFQPERF
jgi:K+-transporting ATPase KdpF subunit